MDNIDNSKLWDKVLVEIELSISNANFNTWFKNTFISKYQTGVVYLSVPNAFVRDWLSKKYHSVILKSLRTTSGNKIHSLKFIITKPEEKEQKNETKKTPQSSQELPLANIYINKDSNLNPRYNFNSFIVGPFNELAFAAAQATIKQPGVVYNPLFIYGSTGHGKTHLIQAIGNSIKEHSPEKKVFYITSETFAVNYVNSIQTNKMNLFKEKYRKYDVLIMDDIQFLSNKEKTQEELFHLFNTLYDKNKQIIFSSDKHPNYIPNLEDRLKSRFNAGMIIDIPTPDKESRSAILRKKSEMCNIKLSEEVLDFLAYSIEGNVRDLEGVLNSIVFQTQLKGKDLNVSDIKELIKNTTKPKKITPPEEIVKIVAKFYNIDEKQIYEKMRKKEVVKPRQLTMFILREHYKISYPSIGEKLGGRDHTTVIHSCERVREDLKNNDNLYRELNQIRALIG